MMRNLWPHHYRFALTVVFLNIYETKISPLSSQLSVSLRSPWTRHLVLVHRKLSLFKKKMTNFFSLCIWKKRRKEVIVDPKFLIVLSRAAPRPHQTKETGVTHPHDNDPFTLPSLLASETLVHAATSAWQTSAIVVLQISPSAEYKLGKKNK